MNSKDHQSQAEVCIAQARRQMVELEASVRVQNNVTINYSLDIIKATLAMGQVHATLATMPERHG